MQVVVPGPAGACQLGFNEYDQLARVAVREPRAAFKSEERIERDWLRLRFHERPHLEKAVREHDVFRQILIGHGAEVFILSGDENLTLDSIYPRDALLVSPAGLIRCNMSRVSRQHEPSVNALELDIGVAGEILAPGTIEGGDLIWLDSNSIAVGLGPRTNQAGIDQLHYIVGEAVEIQVVPLPAPDHPEDVFHPMSMVSPLDKDLALIYRPLMPSGFVDWLEGKVITFVEVPEDEFLPMGCNVLATGPRRVVMLDRLPITRSRLEAAGCDVTPYKGDEISRKAEGGPTCLTRPLLRV
ncbi:MAG TPA: amidinotransferase [Porticoccaceae bacterium]|nr:amidinotransferase [Porticoccaceae bacterium]